MFEVCTSGVTTDAFYVTVDKINESIEGKSHLHFTLCRMNQCKLNAFALVQQLRCTISWIDRSTASIHRLIVD